MLINAVTQVLHFYFLLKTLNVSLKYLLIELVYSLFSKNNPSLCVFCQIDPINNLISL